MKSKLFSLFLLTAILSLAIVNAATNFTITQPNSLTKSVNETSFSIIANSNVTMNIPRFTDLTDGDGHTIILTQSVSGATPTGNPNEYNITAGDTATITISHSLTDSEKEDLALGTFSNSILVSDGAENETITLNFISGFCENGELKGQITEGERYLEIISIKDKSSSTDWEWKPRDDVDIDVKVKFRSDDNDDSIDGIIKIGLYDTETNEFIDLDDEDDLEREISLDEGESTTERFTITIPVEDIYDSSSRYKLYVKAYEDGEEDTLCTDHEDSDYFQDIKIEKNSYDVILDNIDLTTPVPCGEEAEVTATLYNIGTHDEDKVIARIYNKELDVDLTSDVYSLDEGDSQKVSFTFRIPEDAEEKIYTLKLWTEFKYKKSSETYREQSDDYTYTLKVEGNCKAEEIKSALITAELDSETPEAIAGKQVIVKSTIKNTGNTATTYTISVYGNSAWSSLSAIDPQTITLNPGESKDVNIFLDIDKDTEGEKRLYIQLKDTQGNIIKVKLPDGQIADSQGVELVIQKGVTQDVIINHLKENWFIYLIALINIILIIAIIAVVKSMVRRPSA